MAEPQTLPLAGVKVIEFTHMVMGPAAGLILADLGADVVRSSRGGGHPPPARFRRWLLPHV